jgi:L-aspartate oxidase
LSQASPSSLPQPPRKGFDKLSPNGGEGEQSAPFDILIIGSGAAGLSAALSLSPELRVGVLAKGKLSAGSTAWAQGGIAAVLDTGDTFERHVEDTITAGAGLNDRTAVEFVVGNAPAAIERLAALGVPFNPGGERWHLTREGGHSHRRIVHVDDATGWAVQQALENAAAKRTNLRLIPDMVAIDLVTGRHAIGGNGRRRVWGVYALNRTTGAVETITARATILATGGASRAWLYSTNPRGSTGDGIAMAWRAGCRVANMEFNQFHPTCLHNPIVKNFLITEAMRGEGGQLRIPDTGHRFMPDFDPREELAPRDIVARAIDHELKRLGIDYVHLDISHRDPDFVRTHFPTIAARLAEPDIGIDITREPIPVVPAAHYTLRRRGGGPWPPDGPRSCNAAAERGHHVPACTAPTACVQFVLECLVFGVAAAEQINGNWSESRAAAADPPWMRPRHSPRRRGRRPHNWREIRTLYVDYVGIVAPPNASNAPSDRVNLQRQETRLLRPFPRHPGLVDFATSSRVSWA